MHKVLNVNDNGYKNIIVIESDDDIKATAKKLTKLIFDKYELHIIDMMIKNNYAYLKENEQNFVKDKGVKTLNTLHEKINTYLYEKIYDFIKEEDSIDIMGFIRFRTGEYIANIENAIDSAVNEFIIEKEYDRLIDGLVLYAELQVPLIDTINILQCNEKYIVTDKNGEEIFSLKYFDDVLLDVILTLAPKRIIIINAGNFKNKELLDTISRIFLSKVILINSSENCINNKISISKEDKE